VKKISSNITKT
jgi:hypothetical protein